MYDSVEVLLLREKVIEIEIKGVEANSIPITAEDNSAGRTTLEFLKRGCKYGFKIKITKGIPPGSGLGSSGASSAATAVAINHLLNLKLNKKELTELAAQGEIAAAGSPHADNVAPSIYGGFTIISSYHPLEIHAFPPTKELEFSIALPRGIKKTTKKARDVLPKTVELTKVINNLGGASTIVAGFLQSNAQLIGKGMINDQIIEPVRAPIYPGYLNAKKAALEAGAYGATLSGAGPAIIAIVDREKGNPIEVSKVMTEAFEAEGVQCNGYVSQPTKGAHIVNH